MVEPLTLLAAATAATGLWAAYRMRCRAIRAESRLAGLAGQLEAARHAANHDSLTGLYNRRGFHQRGEVLLTDRTQFPILAIVVDLDAFKQVNDAFGHAAGDRVLTTIGRRLTHFVGDGAVARLGGDEFAALMGNVPVDPGSRDQARKRLASQLGAPIEIGGEAVRIHASIGLAPVTGPTRLAEALALADTDMYRTKSLTSAASLPLDNASIAEV
ncbi:GGDEF domain-containing protein [Plantactinospora sp. GCM10030261]|uniref:GGDEF domain-containing protein n=1 Tax=Plantactinospora sp. GCM10030261 TaxID=3273420 RepID=UPI00361CE540